MFECQTPGVKVQAAIGFCAIGTVTQYRMARFGQVNSYLMGPARQGAGQDKHTVFCPAQHSKNSLSFFAFAFPNRCIFAACLPDIRIRRP